MITKFPSTHKPSHNGTNVQALLSTLQVWRLENHAPYHIVWLFQCISYTSKCGDIQEGLKAMLLNQSLNVSVHFLYQQSVETSKKGWKPYSQLEPECISKHPNHMTTNYVQSCVPFHVQWVKAYAELNLTWNWHAVRPSLLSFLIS